MIILEPNITDEYLALIKNIEIPNINIYSNNLFKIKDNNIGGINNMKARNKQNLSIKYNFKSDNNSLDFEKILSRLFKKFLINYESSK